MSTDSLGDLARRLKAIEDQLGALGTDQLGSSTVGDFEADVVQLQDVVVDAVVTNGAVPGLQDDVADQDDVASDLQLQLLAASEELDSRLEEAAAELDDARADIEASMADVNETFSTQYEGLSEDVGTAIKAAGDAKTEAEAASDAALAAAGLAASKGETIVQVSAPTGTRANTANLWIDISTNPDGVPKNQPNRYNPDTAKWEPITDAQTVAAAQAAATAVAAAQAAKDVAAQANAAAGVAQQTASDANTAALTAAGIANGKGKVIYQASKPTGANAAVGNLWIRSSDNTPWAYDTSSSEWVQVTDKAATDAAAAAVAANQAATAAANAAKAAQDTADGKPLILFSSTAGPSGTAPTGTIWFLWDTAKNVAGQWLQSGTLAAPVWTPQQIRSEVIANLDVAKLTAGSAAIAALVAQKIAAATANFQTVNVSNLFVTSGATMSQATIDFLFANVVQAKKITAGQIEAGSFTTDSFYVRGMSVSDYIILAPQPGDAGYDKYRQTSIGDSRVALSARPYVDGSYLVGKAHRAAWSLDNFDGRAYLSATPYVNGDSTDPTYIVSIADTDSEVSSRRRWGLLTSYGIWSNMLRIRGNAHADLSVVRVGSSADKGPYGLGMSNTWNDPAPKMIIDTSNDASSGSARVAKINTFGGPVTAGVVQGSDFQLLDGTSILADTGWVTLPLASGYVAHSSRTPQIRMKGGVIYLRGGVAKSDGSVWTAGNIVIANIPDAFKGSYPANQYIPVFNGFSGSVGTVTLPSNRATVQYQPNISNTTYMYLDAVFWLAP